MRKELVLYQLARREMKKGEFKNAQVIVEAALNTSKGEDILRMIACDYCRYTNTTIGMMILEKLGQNGDKKAARLHSFLRSKFPEKEELAFDPLEILRVKIKTDTRGEEKTNKTERTDSRMGFVYILKRGDESEAKVFEFVHKIPQFIKMTGLKRNGFAAETNIPAADLYRYGTETKRITSKSLQRILEALHRFEILRKNQEFMKHYRELRDE